MPGDVRPRRRLVMSERHAAAAGGFLDSLVLCHKAFRICRKAFRGRLTRTPPAPAFPATRAFPGRPDYPGGMSETPQDNFGARRVIAVAQRPQSIRCTAGSRRALTANARIEAFTGHIGWVQSCALPAGGSPIISQRVKARASRPRHTGFFLRAPAPGVTSAGSLRIRTRGTSRACPPKPSDGFPVDR